MFHVLFQGSCMPRQADHLPCFPFHHTSVFRFQLHLTHPRSSPPPACLQLLVKLLSTAGTGYFYVARKNPRKLPKKLEFVK